SAASSAAPVAGGLSPPLPDETTRPHTRVIGQNVCMAGACRLWFSPGSAAPALLDPVAILDAESRPVEKIRLFPARVGFDHLRNAARWCPRLWSNERPRAPGCLSTQIPQPVDSTAGMIDIQSSMGSQEVLDGFIRASFEWVRGLRDCVAVLGQFQPREQVIVTD